MQFSFHSARRLCFPALFSLFLLSILNIAIATPLPQNDVAVKSLATRGSPPPIFPDEPSGPQITLEEYVAYLRKYYPDTDKYIEYSGNSENQVKAFKAKNPGYYYYEDFFNAETSKHYYTAFPKKEDRMDDGEASGTAISIVATKQITVFGAADYQTLGPNSFYTKTEVKTNKAALKSGRLQSINHMAKDATHPSQIMAKEDANGKLTYQPSYKARTPNNSGSFGTCKRSASAICDAPSLSKSQSSKKTSKTTAKTSKTSTKAPKTSKKVSKTSASH